MTWVRPGALVLGATLAWTVGVAGWIVSRAGAEPGGPADVIVVLGAAAYGSEPSPVFRERIEHALALHRDGAAPRLLFTGGKRKDTDLTEAEVAKRYALDRGVAPERILCEEESTSTLENLANAWALMQRNGLTRAILVSDPLHLARAELLARRLGMTVAISATPSTRFRTLATQAPFLLRECYFVTTALVGLAR